MTEKKKGDGHIKFILRGGPMTGVTVRLYPEFRLDEHGIPDRTNPTFDGFRLPSGTYTQPDIGQQDATKPFLLFVSG